MEFIESPAFTRYLSHYLDDQGYRELQIELVRNPHAGALMPGTGGFRKLRWADRRRSKGRRGGLRIIYYHFAGDQQIWMMALFDKGEASDLSPSQKKVLNSAIEAELEEREAARKLRNRKAGRTRK